MKYCKKCQANFIEPWCPFCYCTWNDIDFGEEENGTIEEKNDDEGELR